MNRSHLRCVKRGQEEVKAAIERASEGMNQDPSQWESVFSDGLALVQQGRSQLAKGALDRAANLISARIEHMSERLQDHTSEAKRAAIASDSIGRAYLKLGDAANAREEFWVASRLYRKLSPQRPSEFDNLSRFRDQLVAEFMGQFDRDRFREYIIDAAEGSTELIEDVLVVQAGDDRLREYLVREEAEEEPSDLEDRFMLEPGEWMDTDRLRREVVFEANDDPASLYEYVIRRSTEKTHYVMATSLGLEPCLHGCWVEGGVCFVHPPCLR